MSEAFIKTTCTFDGVENFTAFDILFECENTDKHKKFSLNEKEIKELRNQINDILSHFNDCRAEIRLKSD